MSNPFHNLLIDVTPEQKEALEWALELAFDDQQHYLKVGDPVKDYGAEWPEACAIKAAHCRAIAGMSLYRGESEQWEQLAKDFESTLQKPEGTEL